jgi:hypothetical protein
MTVESELQELAHKAEAFLEEAERAANPATRKQLLLKRSTTMQDASDFVAQTAEELRIKASMLRDEDYFHREPTVGVASLIRSLLHDLREWKG